MQNPKYRLLICAHPSHSQWMRLHLPPALISTHLNQVKQLHGRKWNALEKCWDVPLTKINVRMVKKYLADVAHWSFSIPEDIPDDLKQTKSPPAIRKDRAHISREDEVKALYCFQMKMTYVNRFFCAYSSLKILAVATAMPAFFASIRLKINRFPSTTSSFENSIRTDPTLEKV